MALLRIIWDYAGLILIFGLILLVGFVLGALADAAGGARLAGPIMLALTLLLMAMGFVAGVRK